VEAAMTFRHIVVAVVVTLHAGLALAAQAQSAKTADTPELYDTNCFAAVNSGAGLNTFNVCISDTGRVTNITSPAGFAHIYAGLSGFYYLCDDRHGTYSGDGVFDFYTSSIAQPKGPNTLPLTIVTRTFDDLWQVTHAFARNANELELVITETLTNLGGPVGSVSFARYADTAIDNGDAGDIGDRSLSAVTVRDRPGDDTTTGHGLTLTALTRTIGHATAVSDYYQARGCNPSSMASPTGPKDLGFNVTYNLSNFNALQTKVVKFKFERD
jgi:hypothetical protein